MMRGLILLIQIFVFPPSLLFGKCRSSGKNQSSIQKYGKSFPANCSYGNMDVDVYILSAANLSDEGLVKLLVLSFNHELYTVCYPGDNFDANGEVATLSHVVCRQLGYMTFAAAGYQHSFPASVEPQSVKANIYCKGHEQSLVHCSWCDLTFDRCNSVLAIHCTTCHSVLEAAEGFITNPGYPHAYLYTVRCQWDIIVPEKNTILLTFRQLSLPRSLMGSTSCELGQPYMEIVYGTQGALSIYRYCAFSQVKTVQVPYREVKVRFYSGIYSGSASDNEKDYGFNLLFQAQPVVSSTFQTYKLIVILGTLGTFVFMILVCYCCRKWGRKFTRSNRVVGNAASNNADMRQSQRTVAFRQRPSGRTGMKIDKENILPQLQTAHNPGPGTEVSNSSESRQRNAEVAFGRDLQPLPYGRTAPACCGTPHRPRNDAPVNQSRSGLLSKLKRSLFQRFSSDSARNSVRSTSVGSQVDAQPTVDPQVTDFRIYSSFETSSDSAVERGHHDPDNSCSSTHVGATSVKDCDLSQPSAAVTPRIPTIVVECVDDATEVYECPKPAEENQYLKLSP